MSCMSLMSLHVWYPSATAWLTKTETGVCIHPFSSEYFPNLMRGNRNGLSVYVSCAKAVKLSHGRQETGQKLAGCPGRALMTPVTSRYCSISSTTV